MSFLNDIVAALGIGAAIWIVAVVIHRMKRRRHATALWLLAAGIGMTNIATLCLSAGSGLDTGLTLTGDAMVVLGGWAIILTRWRCGEVS